MGIDFKFLYRKKIYDAASVHETKLARVLSVFDITSLAVSFTIVAAYVLFGQVIVYTTGPSLVISMVISGLTTFLAALCYAELGSRVPRAGSAYTYIYVTIGEFVAYVLGWDLILEYVIGAAGASSGLSLYIDIFFNNAIHNAFKQYLSFSILGLSITPDILAFFIAIIATLILLISVQQSAWFTKIVTVFNVAIITLIIAVGASKIDFNNWFIPEAPGNFTWGLSNLTCTDPERIGSGGFFPFGIAGTIAGSAKCFVGYIGFDAICAAGEELKNPEKNIPKSIMITLAIVTAIYLTVSLVLTTIMPYCILEPITSFPQAFSLTGLTWMKHLVSAGTTLSMIASLNSGMYPMPRIAYNMAVDGLIFQPFTKVLPKFKTPFVAILATGIFSALLCLFLDINELIDMMSIGTLLAYSIVCICVLILRYRPAKTTPEEASYIQYLNQANGVSAIKKIFGKVSANCDLKSSQLVNYWTLVCTFSIIILSALIKFLPSLREPYAIFLVALFALFTLLSSVVIWLQPQNEFIETFKAPLLPVWPLLAVFINVYLIFCLSTPTWYRLAGWLVIGLVIYFSYGVRHSKENKNRIAPVEQSRTASTHQS